MKKFLAAIIGSLAAFAGMAQAPVRSTVEHPDWSRNAVIYEVNIRQYTPEGTFAAFEKHLPRLRDLGVDILWFMPVHPISELNRKGTLGSYYAVRDYKDVNPEFGTLADFRHLVEAAHSQGFKVIIDWVPNHTGCDNAWVTTNPDRYERNEKGEMFGPYDWSDVYKLDYANPDTRAAMIDAMRFWVSECAIDGFRCDVAGLVPVDFWNDARRAIRDAAGQPVFMLAEATEPELTEHAFDMDYNWPMKDLFSEIAATSGHYRFTAPGQTEPRKFPTKKAADIDSLLALQQRQYPADSYMMNMTSNHDLNSWEGTEFERLGVLSQAFAVLSYTLPGMPLIYTGQETGLNRALEFFEKDTPPTWEPHNYFFGFYRILNDLKHSRPELAAGIAGGAVRSYPTGSDNIYVFSRTTGKSTTIVGVNLGNNTEAITFDKGKEPAFADATDIFTGRKAAGIPSSLAPGEFFVYIINE